jgi:starvation-inducible DNA-binding protein
MNTTTQLTQVFNDNFVAYFRSHVAHVNTVGRNFSSDHALLGEVYEDLQDQIDTIAELLRTLGEEMPSSIEDVISGSGFDSDTFGDAYRLLEIVRGTLDALKMEYESLMEVSEQEGHKEIANYAQDRILAIAKFIWKLDSTLA